MYNLQQYYHIAGVALTASDIKVFCQITVFTRSSFAITSLFEIYIIYLQSSLELVNNISCHLPAFTLTCLLNMIPLSLTSLHM